MDICGHTLLDDGMLLPEAQLNQLRMQVGMVFQGFNLFPHLSVLDNVTVGPRTLRGMGRGEANALAEDLLRKVGLSQRQRPCRPAFRAAKSSAWPSPGRWPCSLR